VTNNQKLQNRYGSWGICFTYGTWFGVKGLIAAGKSFSNSLSIRKACDFLLSKQLPSGGWGESYLSSQNKVSLPLLMSISLLHKTMHPIKLICYFKGLYRSNCFKEKLKQMLISNVNGSMLHPRSVQDVSK